MNRYGAKWIEEFLHIWDMRFLIIGAMFLFLLSSAYGATMQTIDDANVYISAEQARLGSGWVTAEIQPKKLNTSYDVAFGFDSDNAVPRYLQFWQNNYTTNVSANSTTYLTTYENWTQLSPSGNIAFNYDGKDRWYYFSNVNLNTNRRYRLKFYLEVIGNGKYDVAMKLNSDSFANAIANNRLYILDPVYNATQENLRLEFDYDWNNTGINATGTWTSSCTLSTTSPKIGTKIGDCTGGVTQRFNRSMGSWDIATTKGCAMAWVKWTSIPDEWFFRNDAGGGDNLGAYTTSAGTTFTGIIGTKTCAVKAIGANIWYHIVFSWDSGTARCYLNGTMYDSGASTGVITGENIWGADWIGGGRNSNALFDDVRIYLGKNCTGANISYVYNSSVGTPFPIEYNFPVYPTISFDKQVPANLTIVNVLSKSVNISYNYTLIAPNNLTNAILFYNMTTGDGKPCIFVNGTIACGNFNTTSISNTSTTITFRLFDASLLPATYNFPERDMEQTTHINATMQDYLKINLNNISSTRNYGFFEIMATNTSGAILPIYFCNSSYSSGKPETDPNCGEFGSIDPKPYDHIHSIYSAHHIIPFVVANGTIAGVGVTSKGSFIMPGSANWIFMYISNVSRANATMLSNNQGNSYTSVIGTADAHLHQFDPGNDSITYYACINQTDGMGICSTPINSLVGLSALPPSSPVVISPTNGTYNDTILINYTASTSATGYILYYGIGLEDSNHNPVYTIIANNSLALTYNFNTSLVANGQYYAIVTAFDNQSLNTTGESALFTISNFIPPAPVAAGDAITRATDRFFFAILIFLAIMAYFFSFFIGTIGSLVLKLMSFALFMSSGAFVPDAKFTYLVIAFSSLVMIHLVVHFILIASGDVDA